MKNLTAKMSCFVRAYHHTVQDTHVFDDPYAAALLNEDYQQIAAHLRQGIEFFLPSFSGTPEEGLRRIVEEQLGPSVLARSAWCLDLLKKQSAKQILLFGAGYDTFSVRNNDPDLHIFEMDLPEMIQDKKDRLNKAGLHAHAEWIGCDLADDAWMNLLLEHGYDPKNKSFASLLGLVYYLAPTEFATLLERMNTIMTADSSLCFDVPLRQESTVTTKNSALAAEAGEQMKAAYTQEELQTLLSNSGFCIYTDLSDKKMTQLYFADYNQANPSTPMHAPEGVAYIWAIKK